MTRNVHWTSSSLLIGLLSLVSACSSGEDGEATPTPEPPSARVLFYHEVSDLGAIEVDLDGQSLITVDPGELSAAVKIEPGERTLTIRNPGAASSLYEESISFAAQTYLIGFTGSSTGGNLSYWKVDQQPPEIAAGSAAVEVVSLYDGQTHFDLYAGETQLATEVETQSVSAFVTLPAGDSTLKVFNAGSDPSTDLPIVTTTISLGDGSASMLLLQNQDGTVGIDLIDVL